MTRRSLRPGTTAGVSTTRRAPVALGALVVAAALGGCSGDAPSEPPEGAPSGSAATTDARTTVEVGRVTGALARARRADAADAVGAVAERWFVSAYLGADGPPSGVDDAFPGFTRGAAAQARADRALTTNAGLAGAEDVVARRADVVVDLLATGGRAQAATAGFTLVMQVTGERERVERVGGHLYLTPGGARGGPGWQVVGYDVERGRQR